MSTDRNTSQGPLNRRQFLGIGAGAGRRCCWPPAAAAPAPRRAAAAERRGGQFGEGKDYTGPNVSLAFWNGFTGGDGPFMRKLVEQFNSEHQNIKVSMNTLQWGDFYPRSRRRCRAATAPTSPSCTSTSWPPTPPAG